MPEAARGSKVSIDIFAMTYPDVPHDEDIVLGRMDQAVVADLHSVVVLLSLQLFKAKDLCTPCLIMIFNECTMSRSRHPALRERIEFRGYGGCSRNLSYNSFMSFESLPGGDYMRAGIEDLSRGIESIPALLVSIGAPRLRSLGLRVPDPVMPSPEHRLYELLRREDADAAHSRYNALIRKLVSFERAAECEK